MMRRRSFLSLVAVGLFATGCATSAASVRPTSDAPGHTALAQYRNLGIRVIKADGEAAALADVDRLRARIVDVIRKRVPARFGEIDDGASASATPSVLDVTVVVTRYDEGNAFARFMLAGLGQIHIDGKVSLKDRDNDVLLGDYDVNKTFAWGGIYGASTGIKDVEEGFAQGVAVLILGEESK